MNTQPDSAEKLSDYERHLLDSIPSQDQYPNAGAKQVLALLKKLPEKKQLEVLKRLGVTPENPLSISGEIKSKLLNVLAEVTFNVDKESRGKRRLEISTPTGGSSKRRK